MLITFAIRARWNADSIGIDRLSTTFFFVFVEVQSVTLTSFGNSICMCEVKRRSDGWGVE